MEDAEFIEKAKEVHGDKYDYSLSHYNMDRSLRTIIICPHHGEFEQRPKNHLAGRGCNKCAVDANSALKMLKAKQGLIERFSQIHGDIYDYSNFEYSGMAKKSKVICKDHGEFFVSPNNHLWGRACPSCAKSGYKSNLPGYFYVMSFGNLTKVGITNRQVSLRLSSIRLSSGLNFVVTTSFYFNDGRVPLEIEAKILSELRKIYDQPTEKFQGYTEVFIDANVDNILSRVHELSKEQLNENSTRS